MMSIQMEPKLRKIITSFRASDNKYGNISLIISHFAYAIFYIIDNIAILSKIKFFKGMHAYQYVIIFRKRVLKN